MGSRINSFPRIHRPEQAEQPVTIDRYKVEYYCSEGIRTIFCRFNDFTDALGTAVRQHRAGRGRTVTLSNYEDCLILTLRPHPA